MISKDLMDVLQGVSLAAAVRFFYLNAILVTITLNVFPPFARKLYTYGKNAQISNGDKEKKEESLLDVPLNLLAKLQVPHGWFTHFYAFSLAVQLFWLLQILSHGRILQSFLSILPNSDAVTPPDSPQIVPAPPGQQSFETILLCIICMGMQSARRLYEALEVQKPGTSKMGILIYIAGLTHYTAMGFATFAEGIDTLRLNSNLPLSHPSNLLKPPRVNTLIALPFFFLATGFQHDAHVHLASLVKYSYPTHPLFAYTLSPHYLAECVIYASFVVLGAPTGRWVNTTLLYVSVFVCVNLTFCAGITRSWYEDVPQVEAADEIEVAADSTTAKGAMSVEEALKGVLRHALIHDGLARGLREASKALDRRQAHMCVLNENCEEDAYKKLVEALCAEHKIPLIKVGDGKKLGEWAGLCTLDREGNPRKVVNCSCVVVRDWGEESTERSILLDYFQTR
ncbi:hypothetical protein H072_1728 [Dactylellina haptotyla CBS 200.50]|uniref:40S ribosomal protein S12 n=1 Tax=Dactylellina haptotyla (strain CBS 200.50) TaxID=1284197 RepID=S8AMZ2_DACHA|nr:hypothetical protein H072_1728 [Dactylellina haptotyla CBS 200.50]